MKKTMLIITLVAIIALTACSMGSETSAEAPPVTIGNAAVTQTPAPTVNKNEEGALPGDSFDRQFTGFWSDTDGWLVGCKDSVGGNDTSNYHYIYLTGDGGKTWTETGNLNDYYTLPVTCSYFLNDSVGFLGFHYDFEYTGLVFCTENGGRTWMELSIPALPEDEGLYWQREPREIRAVNGNIELDFFISTSYYGETGMLYTSVSEDMGKTWGSFTYSGEVKGSVPTGSFDRQITYFWTKNDGWFVGSKDAEGTVMSYHYVYLTNDGGKTWMETGNLNDYCTMPVTCAFFYNETVGFLGFHYDSDYTGPVFRTEDGGRTWTELSIPSLSDILGDNWRAEAREIRNLGDILELTYFISTSDSGDTGLLYTSISDDMGKTWGTFTPSGIMNDVGTSALRAYKSVLINGGSFIHTVEHKSMDLSEYVDTFNTINMANGAFLAITEFAIVDLDNDGISEVILTESVNGNDSGVLVLRYQDEEIYAYGLAYRAFMDLKTDGTFYFSYGVADSGFGSIGFEQATYSIDKITYC